MQKYMRKYCYSMGRFCVDVEKANIKKPLEMIDEAIRQICLWKQTPLNYDDPKNPPKENPHPKNSSKKSPKKNPKK